MYMKAGRRRIDSASASATNSAVLLHSATTSTHRPYLGDQYANRGEHSDPAMLNFRLAPLLDRLGALVRGQPSRVKVLSLGGHAEGGAREGRSVVVLLGHLHGSGSGSSSRGAATNRSRKR